MKDLFGNEIVEKTDDKEHKIKKLSPFDFVNTINMTKKNLIRDEYGINEQNENAYNSWIINKSLSYFVDTLEHANLMNLYDMHLDPIMKYEYYLNAVRKRKRFSKWAKVINNEDVELLMNYYQISHHKANEYLRILTKEQLEEIKNEYYNGRKF